MKFDYFIYDNVNSLSMGLDVCYFNNSSQGDSISNDSKYDWTLLSLFDGAYQPFIYSHFEDTLQFEFSVCKRNCYGVDDSIFSPSEASKIKRWLNRGQSCRLILSSALDIYYQGSFNVTQVIYSSNIVGFNLTFKSDRPFGSKMISPYSGTVTKDSPIIVIDQSDNIGYVYPSLQLTLKESGDLKLTNKIDNRQTIVKNCTTGEILNFTDTQQLFTSLPSHNVLDDFNFVFQRITNTFNNAVNEISSNLSCDYVMTYVPSSKVVIL